MKEVYLSLGSNLGDRRENLSRALTMLSREVELERVSSIYETEPVGYREQPLFLNMSCHIATDLGPDELLRLAKKVEEEMGRVLDFPNSPRLIDIDILFYGDRVVETADLIIPHPRLHERAFVLMPLFELAPQLLHPILEKTVAELAAGVEGRTGVQKWQQGEFDVQAICRGTF
ncbi:MAG: 2-amino-4-hydroxy-6-hydroxymethyldihydropteridine diphosphokinase [Dehalococcoidia bacterium]|nr:2-amino-4-hydroxy-6-hydroxymethyldihydropteridine diphosphokinase [Dehalococcoidia bacterium]